MKLIDFIKFPLFVEQREKMNIKDSELISVDNNLQFEKTKWEDIKIGKGLDIVINEIEVLPDGTLEYEGQKIIVYIRDQKISYNGVQAEYKFHIAWCKTLEDMKEKGRYSRYVVSQREDGNFYVNLLNGNNVVKRDSLEPMKVCKNCLNRLNYNNYIANKNQVYEKFKIIEFLEKYNTKISIRPKYNDRNAPLSVYSEDWNHTSFELRKRANWKCSKCGRDYTNDKKNLHVHHINGVLGDDSITNLIVLCKECHSKEAMHSHIK